MSTSGNDPREPRPGSGGEDAAFEAAWREIISRYDERPVSGDGPTAPRVPLVDPDRTKERNVWLHGSESTRDRDLETVDDEAPDTADRAAFDDLIGETRPRLSPGEMSETAGFQNEIDADFEQQYGEQFDAQLAADLDDPALLAPSPAPAWTPAEAGTSAESDDRYAYRAPHPPLPRSAPERWLAWITLLGVPAVVVLCTVFDSRPTELILWALGAAWLGSFAYLVATMNDDPREPWDDGSRV